MVYEGEMVEVGGLEEREVAGGGEWSGVEWSVRWGWTD